MPTFTAREVRAWALANDIDCPPRGVVPRHVVDAYLVDVHGVTTDPGDDVQQPQAETLAVEEDADATFTIDVTIAGHDEAAADIAQQLVNAVWRAFEAGRAAERADILAALAAGGEQ